MLCIALAYFITPFVSQLGTCNLLLLKSDFACTYWSMLLEVFIWSLLSIPALIILILVLIGVIAIVLAPFALIIICIAFPWAIIIGIGCMFKNFSLME